MTSKAKNGYRGRPLFGRVGSPGRSCSSKVGDLAIAAMPRVETEEIENVLLKESVTVPTF